jgi:hypothetical protein
LSVWRLVATRRQKAISKAKRDDSADDGDRDLRICCPQVGLDWMIDGYTMNSGSERHHGYFRITRDPA